MAPDRSFLDLQQALAQWQAAGIITPEQAERITALESAQSHRRPTIGAAQVLTWLGGVLVLVASVVFVGAGWGDMGNTERTFWALLAVVVPWALAWWMRRRAGSLYLHTSNILIMIGTVAMILLAIMLYRVTGLWHDGPIQPGERDPDTVRIAIAEALAAAVGVFWAFRVRTAWMLVPSLLIGWLAWFTIAQDQRQLEDSLRLGLVSAAYGMVLIVAAWLLARSRWVNHARWLLVLGLVVVLLSLGISGFGDPTGLNGLLFLCAAIAAVVLGMITDLRHFLVIGAFSLYAWLSVLVIETFGGSRPVAFALTLVGAVVVAAGVLWQRYNRTPAS